MTDAAGIVRRARADVIQAARDYAALGHGNYRGDAYARRKETRAKLIGALEVLDVLTRRKGTGP